MFIKLDGTTILNHWDHADQGLGITTEISEPPANAAGFKVLVNNDGDYKYKYVNSALVELTQQEIEAHPVYKAKKLAQLKNKASQDIAALDEAKAHSLGAKKAMGGTLAGDETTFVNDFISARAAILAQYDIDKVAYV